jgi:transposase
VRGHPHRRQSYRRNAWIAAVDADDQPDLRSFATESAVAITTPCATVSPLPHSCGVVDDHVNRIKTIRRQMYVRANLDLPRERALLA